MISKATIGEVIVHEGEPKNGNPYAENGLMGSERVRALTLLKRGGDTSAYTFWKITHGVATRCRAEEVNWETSGIK